MRVLWICGLPAIAQEIALKGKDHGSQATWSWIVGHLPPPSHIELHIGCLWPGGTERKSFEFQHATFHLLPCPAKGRALFLFLRDTAYFKPLFAEIAPDVVHGWGTEDSFGLVARRLAPWRHVIGIQGLISSIHKHFATSYRWLLVRMTEYLTLRKARDIVAESRFALDTAGRLSPNSVKRIIEHPLRREFLESTPGDGSGRTVLYVGMIHESKGVTDALTAFWKTAPATWKLHLVGRGTLENETVMLRLVQEMKLGARFRHSRTLDMPDLIRAMQESSIFLLPTRIDTGPTALKEALTMGLWPICYDNSGPAEYIRKYEFGSLAKDLDLDSLCRELAKSLAETPWRDLGKRQVLARRSREDFSKERAWNQLTDLYVTIASRSC